MGLSCNFLVTVALLLCHTAITVQASDITRTVYIRPENTSNATCPGLPCETLDRYANVSHVNNTQFVFLPGVHTLSKSFKLSNLQFIQLVSFNGLYPTPRVICNWTSFGFIFQNVNSLTVKNLNIVYCGQMIPKTVYNVSLPVQAAVALKQVSTLTMYSVTVQNSSGYGLVAEGLYGNSSISNCQFKYNHGSGKYIGGNVAILYRNCPTNYKSTQNNIFVYNTIFSHGRNYRINESISDIAASGLILNITCASINMLLSHVTLEFNNASSYSSRGGNLYVMYDNSYSNSTRISLTIRDSQIANGTAHIGGGAYLNVKSNNMSSVQDCNHNHSSSQQVLFLFENTTFEHNYGSHWGGALYISTFVPDGTINTCPSGELNVKKCMFNRNFVRTRTADAGVAIHAYQYSVGVLPTLLPWFNIIILETNFTYNKLRSVYKMHSRIKGGGVLYIAQHRKEVYIVDSSFEHNQVTAISLFRSNVVFKGNVLVDSNIGIDGGGLVLCEESYMLLVSYTTLTIQNNTALDSGGGIYAQDQCLESNLNCFYQVYPEGNQTFTSVIDTVNVIMINNTANSAGSQIYGGNLDHCRNSLNGELALTSYQKIFNESLWQYNRSDLSYVTSKPRFICFCDPDPNQPNCSKTDFTVEPAIFSGQYVTVSIAAVGQFNNTVPAVVIGKVSARSKIIRYIDAECTPITFRVLSNQSQEKVVLLVSTNEGYRSKQDNSIGGLDPRYLHIYYKKCPLGFVKTSKGDCDCPRNFKYINCNITAQTITIEPPAWVGFNYANTSKDGTVDGMIRYPRCPPYYCTPQGATINTNETFFDQNAQCQSNRRGVLCGACQHGYSLSVGTAECVRCQNSFPGLAGIFIAPIVGFLCIVFIIACDITITDCTLSGLIFYANIVKLDRLSGAPNQNSLLRFFIEWLNIEPGVGGHCFYKGYDEYTRTLLQFPTPLYLWIVIGIMIFLSSKSTRIANLVGRNAVKVLATLFLLSYTKIIQAGVDVFTCAGIIYPSPNKTIFLKEHWYKDGNVPCWQGKHLGLVVIGALFGIAALIYTLILLFVQPLQRYSHHRPLKWVARLKPFIDAYTCPHVIKDRYRFWMGLLLLFRVFSTFTSNSLSVTPFITGMMSVLILTLAWSFGGVYKKWWLNVLNASSYLNLTFLSLTEYYSNNARHLMKTISLSFALATFIIVLTYHILKRLKEIGVCRCCVTRLSSTRLWQSLSTGYQGWRERRYQRVPRQEEPEDDDDLDYDRDQDRELRDNFQNGIDNESGGDYDHAQELQDDFENDGENDKLSDGAETKNDNSNDRGLLHTYTY